MIGSVHVLGQQTIGQVRCALNFIGRGRGWLGYEHTSVLGIWLPATKAVHTFGMRIALDLIWLDQNGFCCAFEQAVPAWRVRYCRQAEAVLELRCGLVDNVKGVHFSWNG